MEQPDQLDLDALNKHLESHPDDEIALLNKLELCVRDRVEPEFVGQYLDGVSAQQQIDSLRAQVDLWARDVMAEGRNKLGGGSVQDALNAFRIAIALLPQDPTISMAVALSLIDAEQSSFRFSRQMTQLLMTEIENHLIHTCKLCTPGSSLYHRARNSLMWYWINEQRVDEVVQALNEQPVEDDLHEEILALVTEHICLKAQTLVRANQTDAVNAFLAKMEALLPVCTQILRGEHLRIAGELEGAEVAFRTALSAPPDPTSLTAVLQLYGQMPDGQMTCEHCERNMAVTETKCPFCGRPPEHHKLIADLYCLEPLPAALYARMGLAQVLADQQRCATAIEVLALIDAAQLQDDTRKALTAWRDELGRQNDQAPLARLYADVKARGPVPELISEIEHVVTITPEAWNALSESERIDLAEQLLADGQLERAQRFVRDAFQGLPEQGSRLVKQFAEVIPEKVETYRSQAEAALDQNLVSEAVAHINRALVLSPQHSALRLMRARAHYRQQNYAACFADAVQVLALTPDDENVRLLCASALEQQRHFDKALLMLEPCIGPDTEALRARLERRSRNEPLVIMRELDYTIMADTLVRSPGVGECHGYFAVAVAAAGRNWNAHPQQWYEHLISQNFKFVQVLGGLHNLPGDPVVALRLISKPNSEIKDYGQLSIALLFHVTGRDTEHCQHVVYELWQTVQDILPGQRESAYVYEPVVDEAELEALLHAPADADSVEIVRRELPSEPYAFAPLLPGSANLHDLCRTLLEQPVPSMLSVHLVPTSLMAWEQAGLDRLVGTGYSETEISIDLSFRPDIIRREYEALNVYLDRSLAGPVYVMGVFVCGPRLLAEQCAAILFRSAGGDVPAGYTLLRPQNPEEEQVLKRAVNDVIVEGWGYTTAPPSLYRLRRLVGPREAMTAFQLPIPGAHGLPGVRSLDVRPVPPPANLAATGMVLGESVTNAQGRPIRILQSIVDRRRHTYIVGKTGTGKSTLLKTMSLQDIEDGQGVCVVDPHGDLIEELLQRIPPHRADDVILFDPADDERPIGLNLLEWRTESHKHQIVNEFIGLLIRMYDPMQQGIVGPRFQHNVRNAMLTAMSIEGGTLIEVVRVLSDRRYVAQILPGVKDPIVRSYWEDQIANTSDYHKSEVLDYIISKFSRFVGDRRVRNIIGQRHSTLDFRQIMDKRQVLLVNLSKGKIGSENAQFLGLLLVQSLLMAALSRADKSSAARPDFFLYVDEFQNFATELFGTVLSEGRKYGVVVALANQYLSQVPPIIREAIFGNVGSLVSFRIGLRDAEIMGLEMAPVFSIADMVNLPLFSTCTRLLLDGIAAQPFTMRTLPDMGIGDPAQARAIRAQSAQRYGRDANQISDEVMARYSRSR